MAEQELHCKQLLEIVKFASPEEYPQANANFLAATIPFLRSLPKCIWCKRSVLTCELMWLFSLPDASPHLQWFQKATRECLQSCRACLTAYYATREPVMQTFATIYDEEAMSAYNAKILRFDEDKLAESFNSLLSDPAQYKSLKVMFALFEVLMAPSWLENKTVGPLFTQVLLQMIASRRMLKAEENLPGVVACLNHPNAIVAKWAHSALTSPSTNIKFAEKCVDINYKVNFDAIKSAEVLFLTLWWMPKEVLLRSRATFLDKMEHFPTEYQSAIYLTIKKRHLESTIGCKVDFLSLLQDESFWTTKTSLAAHLHLHTDWITILKADEKLYLIHNITRWWSLCVAHAEYERILVLLMAQETLLETLLSQCETILSSIQDSSKRKQIAAEFLAKVNFQDTKLSDGSLNELYCAICRPFNPSPPEPSVFSFLKLAETCKYLLLKSFLCEDLQKCARLLISPECAPFLDFYLMALIIPDKSESENDTAQRIEHFKKLTIYVSSPERIELWLQAWARLFTSISDMESAADESIFKFLEKGSHWAKALTIFFAVPAQKTQCKLD